MEKIIPDFKDCRWYSDIHELIDRHIGLWEDGGRNYDALWDMMRDNDVMNRDVIIEVRNLKIMGEHMKRGAEVMREIFLEMEKRSGILKVVFID